MRLVAALVTLFGAGCGRIGFDGTAQGDAPVATHGDLDGPTALPDSCPPLFSPPQLVTELVGLGARGPTLTADGNLIVFGSDVGPSVDLWSATRDGVFGNPEPIAELATAGSDTDPDISPDGLELFFGHGTCIEVARRLTLDDAWGTPTTIPTTCADDGQGASISADGRSLYYTVVNPSPSIAVVRRENRESAFGPRTLVPIPGGMSAGFPFISADELTLYFETQVGTDDYDLYRATRSSITADFDTVVPLSALNGPFIDEDAFVSADGTRLYFSSNRGTGFDLYRSSIICPVAP